MTSSEPSPVVPARDALTAPFWSATAVGELRLQRCTACGRFAFPPTVRCRACRSSVLEWERLSGDGTIHSACTYAAPPAPGFTAPHVVVLVQLDEQPDIVLTSSWPAPSAPPAGARVRVSFVPNGDETLPVFVPVSAP